jgi:hypothetical protein
MRIQNTGGDARMIVFCGGRESLQEKQHVGLERSSPCDGKN